MRKRWREPKQTSFKATNTPGFPNKCFSSRFPLPRVSVSGDVPSTPAGMARTRPPPCPRVRSECKQNSASKTKASTSTHTRTYPPMNFDPSATLPKTNDTSHNGLRGRCPEERVPQNRSTERSPVCPAVWETKYCSPVESLPFESAILQPWLLGCGWRCSWWVPRCECIS